MLLPTCRRRCRHQLLAWRKHRGSDGSFRSHGQSPDSLRCCCCRDTGNGDPQHRSSCASGGSQQLPDPDLRHAAVATGDRLAWLRHGQLVASAGPPRLLVGPGGDVGVPAAAAADRRRFSLRWLGRAGPDDAYVLCRPLDHAAAAVCPGPVQVRGDRHRRPSRHCHRQAPGLRRQRQLQRLRRADLQHQRPAALQPGDDWRPADPHQGPHPRRRQHAGGPGRDAVGVHPAVQVRRQRRLQDLPRGKQRHAASSAPHRPRVGQRTSLPHRSERRRAGALWQRDLHRHRQERRLWRQRSVLPDRPTADDDQVQQQHAGWHWPLAQRRHAGDLWPRRRLRRGAAAL